VRAVRRRGADVGFQAHLVQGVGRDPLLAEVADGGDVKTGEHGDGS
jgi:hypothetical protein